MAQNNNKIFYKFNNMSIEELFKIKNKFSLLENKIDNKIEFIIDNKIFIKSEKLDNLLSSFSRKSITQSNLINVDLILLKKISDLKIENIKNNFSESLLNKSREYIKNQSFLNKKNKNLDIIIKLYEEELNSLINIYNKAIIKQITMISDIQIKINFIDFLRLKMKFSSMDLNDLLNKEKYFKYEKQICNKLIEECRLNINEIEIMKEQKINEITNLEINKLNKIEKSNIFTKIFDLVFQKINKNDCFIKFIINPEMERINNIKNKFFAIEEYIQTNSDYFCKEIDARIKTIPDIAKNYVSEIDKNININGIYLVDKVKNFSNIGLITSLAFSKFEKNDLYDGKIFSIIEKGYKSSIKKIKFGDYNSKKEINIINKILNIKMGLTNVLVSV